MPDPRPPRPERPEDPETPWTPFGPGDKAQPDVRVLRKRLAALKRELEKAQLQLTEMRYGRGPDDTPPEVREVSRADGMWPYLLIRQRVGDVGARPMDMSIVTDRDWIKFFSPDILLTRTGPPGEPVVVDRHGYPALEARTGPLPEGEALDVWVHVWNLGRFQASGVRVRVAMTGPVDFSSLPALPAGGLTYRAGRQLDLGDRLSERAHCLIKAATIEPQDFPADALLAATAECLTDPAPDDRSPGMDRHTAYWLTSY